MPKVLIFAGANGSGKTTLADSVIMKGLEYINADAIMDRENLSYIQAAKKTILLIDKYILSGVDFSFETTMSGMVLIRKFELLKKHRYKVALFYLLVHPLELLRERIKERVKKGGHAVEPADITRRYYRSASNFWTIYRFYADEWAIINNNQFQYRNIAVGDKEEYFVIDKFEFNKFQEVAKYAKKY